MVKDVLKDMVTIILQAETSWNPKSNNNNKAFDLKKQLWHWNDLESFGKKELQELKFLNGQQLKVLHSFLKYSLDGNFINNFNAQKCLKSKFSSFLTK